MVATHAAVRRGDVFVVALDPTIGREIKKMRPCVVLSPDELNRHLDTVMVAPMTTGGHPYPYRVACRFQKRDGYVVLDQLRAVDTNRLVRKLGRLSSQATTRSLSVLQEMFTE
jgi:mRNA interferase MazF